MSPGAVGSGSTVPRPERVSPIQLRRLTRDSTTVVERGGDTLVTGVTAAADRVRPGDLFAALRGARVHGAQYAAQAVGNGAVAVLTDHDGLAALADDVPVLVADDVRRELGEVSAAIYGRPSEHMSVLGVTGTSGKTTTTFLMRAGLQAAGRVPGLIGTVATMIGDDEIKAGFTTPEAPELQALLAVMRERGVTDVAMEVSSHALAMGRVNGIDFTAGAFTNLSEDHLDFHQSMEDYFATKLGLFALTDDPVIVRDDQWGERAVLDRGACTTVATVGDVRGNSWEAHEVVEGGDGSTSFHVIGPWWAGHNRTGDRIPRIEFDMGCAVPGRYNVANALLAVALCREAGVDPGIAAPAISTASVPGRMERVDAGQPFLAVVDYSHKPAAVEGALRALRPLTRGRLIVVLGCGGDRDRGKRPHMGAIAARDADVLVVTDDNPRSEDPAAIRRAMLAGVRDVPSGERGEVLEVGGRADAIAAAVERARGGDTVLVAGKGHETGQEIAGVVHPFDDRVVLRGAIEAAR